MNKLVVSCAAGLLASGMVLADNAEVADEVAAQEEVVVSPFNGLYVGVGLGGSFLKNKIPYVKSKNVNRFVGNVFLGYGRVLNQHFYVGGEALVEFTKQKTYEAEETSGEKTGAMVRNNAITPELALRLGYVCNCNMFYGKIAAARPTAKAWNEDGEYKFKKIVPAFYLGAARAFGNWNANIEAGYQLPHKEEDAKLNGGWKIRAGVSRQFHF